MFWRRTTWLTKRNASEWVWWNVSPLWNFEQLGPCPKAASASSMPRRPKTKLTCGMDQNGGTQWGLDPGHFDDWTKKDLRICDRTFYHWHPLYQHIIIYLHTYTINTCWDTSLCWCTWPNIPTSLRLRKRPMAYSKPCHSGKLLEHHLLNIVHMIRGRDPIAPNATVTEQGRKQPGRDKRGQVKNWTHEIARQPTYMNTVWPPADGPGTRDRHSIEVVASSTCHLTAVPKAAMAAETTP